MKLDPPDQEHKAGWEAKHKELCDVLLGSLVREIAEVEAEYPFSYIVDEWGILDQWGEISDELEEWMDQEIGERGPDWDCIDLARCVVFAFKDANKAALFRLRWN